MKTFEDFNSGDVIALRPYEVTQSEMIEFAKRYDPQTFHTDPEGALATSYAAQTKCWKLHHRAPNLTVELFTVK